MDAPSTSPPRTAHSIHATCSAIGRRKALMGLTGLAGVSLMGLSGCAAFDYTAPDAPVGIGGVEFEDADESLPLAVSAARAAGAGFVLAVNLYPRKESTPPGAPQFMRERDARRRVRITPEVAQADFLLHPDLGYYASPLRSYFVESRHIGEATARAQLPALLARFRGMT